jgi:hypothetical protein
MLSAANANAAVAPSTEPRIRPATPKYAPLATGLLVPEAGPISPIGARTAAPTAEPTTTAVAACHQLKPKLIGNQPMTMMLNVKLPPNSTVKRFRGLECRSSSGM